MLHDGRYGPYVKHGKVNATLPKGTAPESMTIEQAVALIDAKAGTGARPKARAAAPKSAKPAAKRATSTKAAAGKKK